MIDNKHLEERLLLKESAIGTSSLIRCANKLSGLKGPQSECRQLDAFLRELSLYRLEIEKSCRSLRSYSSQLEEYEALEASINSRIQAATAEIAGLTVELQQEKEIRAHRKELEDFAVTVNKHQRSSSTKRKISEMQDSTSSTAAALAAADGEISTRLSQVNRLMAMIGDLETKLTEEGEGAEADDDEREDGGGRGRAPEEVAEAQAEQDADADEAADDAMEEEAPVS